jgi:hypothetical protein
LPRVLEAVLARDADVFARLLLAGRTVARDDAAFFAPRAGVFARAAAVLPLVESGFFLAPGMARRTEAVDRRRVAVGDASRLATGSDVFVENCSLVAGSVATGAGCWASNRSRARVWASFIRFRTWRISSPCRLRPATL